jgi:hypothetical protein
MHLNNASVFNIWQLKPHRSPQILTSRHRYFPSLIRSRRLLNSGKGSPLSSTVIQPL